MISGAHCMIYSSDAEVDREYFRDVLELPNVDVGGGWLIFGLPLTELAVHPADPGNTQELYLMCDDLDAVIGHLGENGRDCTAVEQQSRGRSTRVTLPSGAMIGMFQPAHVRLTQAE